jgi:hypothetical protein
MVVTASRTLCTNNAAFACGRCVIRVPSIWPKRSNQSATVSEPRNIAEICCIAGVSGAHFVMNKQVLAFCGKHAFIGQSGDLYRKSINTQYCRIAR